MWWIAVIFLVFAGIMNSIMDVIRYRWNMCIFKDFPFQQWIDPKISWKNKWKDGDANKGERFFGSSTFLVWLTDLWHFAKMLMLLSIMMAISSSSFYLFPIINWWVDIFILYCSFTIPFEIFFSKIWIKKVK